MRTPKIEWVARNGNIMQPRFYILADPVPRKFTIYKHRMRTYVQLWNIMFTTEPR